MAFPIKIDCCGLVEALKSGTETPLKIRDCKFGGTAQKYQPQGRDGSFDVGTEIYGEDLKPTNTYGLDADVSVSAGKIKLGKFVSITFNQGQQDEFVKKFALEKVSIGTSAAGVVTISASAAEIEDDADDTKQSYYSIPAFVLTTKQIAQDIFGAFAELTGPFHLTKCDAEISCSVKTDDIAGVKISSDCNSGLITVTGTILSSTGAVPTITPNPNDVDLGDGHTSKWVLTRRPFLTEEIPEKAKKSYQFTLELPLVKTDPTKITPPTLTDVELSATWDDDPLAGTLYGKVTGANFHAKQSGETMKVSLVGHEIEYEIEDWEVNDDGTEITFEHSVETDVRYDTANFIANVGATLQKGNISIGHHV